MSPRIRLAGLLLLLIVQAAGADPIPVRTERLQTLLSPQTFSAPATVEPLNRPRLSAQVTGSIAHLPVQVGDNVRTGELLVELDCQVHQQREKNADAALSRANAHRRFAAEQLQRAQNLKRKSSISEEVLDQRRTELLTAEADVRSQQAQLALARIDVERCRILSPFDAVVGERLASEGDLANPGTPLLELVQLDRAEVSAAVRTHEADTLAQAPAPHFEYLGGNLPLRLRALPPLVDERTRTREARLQFVSGSAPVGSAGRLIWSSSERLLPAHLPVRRGEQLGVFVARDGEAVFVPLYGAREGQPARVDLPGDSLLITEGRQRLNHGDAITVMDNGQ